MPDYMWMHMTDKEPEEHAESLFTEAIPEEFTIERWIEVDTGRNWDLEYNYDDKVNWWPGYPIEEFYKHRVEMLRSEGFFEVKEGSGIFKVGGDFKVALSIISM